MKFSGIPASEGLAIGPVYVLSGHDHETETLAELSREESLELFDNTLEKTKGQLEEILASVEDEKKEILNAHMMFLSDPGFVGVMRGKIENNREPVEAVKETTEEMAAVFSAMDNEYMKERASDIKDVGGRLLRNLLGIETKDLSTLVPGTIIIAEDLTPSETAQIDPAIVKGFVTEVGGKTSHSAIMARGMGIPAVLGVPNLMEEIKKCDIIYLDGATGDVIINPTEAEVKEINGKIKALAEEKETLKKLKDSKTETQDGYHVELAANIGGPKDLELVLQNGAEGIGLYRTEFLFMDRQSAPTEDEQFEAYKEVLEKMEGKPVVIRTLDIGGDKEVPYMNLPKEMNPFLGYRAIRICLEDKELFRTQLRALLRASNFGNLKIMFPMISSLEELLDAKSFLNEVKEELTSEGVEVSEFEIGIMIEIPAAAVIGDILAEEVDFFSIGTNDLTQYTTAVDRMNEKISDLYNPYNLGVIRLIKMTIDHAHSKGIWVGMCGELAGDPNFAPLLLGLGLDEFSMGAGSILKIRKMFAEMTTDDAKDLAKRVLASKKPKDILHRN